MFNKIQNEYHENTDKWRFASQRFNHSKKNNENETLMNNLGLENETKYFLKNGHNGTTKSSNHTHSTTETTETINKSLIESQDFETLANLKTKSKDFRKSLENVSLKRTQSVILTKKEDWLSVENYKRSKEILDKQSRKGSKEEKDIDIENSLIDTKTFYKLALWISMCNFPGGFNQIFFSAFLISLTNEKNFDWKSGTLEFSQNVGLTNSLYFLGMASSSITASFYLKFDLRKVLMTFCGFSIIAVLCHCGPSVTLFFFGRFILGYSCGINRNVSSVLLHHLSPTDCRSTSNYIWGLGSKFAGPFIFALAIFDNGSAYYWRLVLCIQLIPPMIYIIVAITAFSGIDSPLRLYRLGERKKIEEILRVYIKPSHTIFMMNCYAKIENDENEFLKKTRGKSCGTIKMWINCYLYELIYGFIFSAIHSQTSLTSFNSFYLLFAVEDRTDKNNIAWAKFNSTCFKIWLLVIGIIGARFQITKYRKKAYCTGLILLSINWFVMSMFFYNDSFSYTIPGGYVVATLEGTCFMPFYSMILEVCGEHLYTISLTAYMLFNTILSLISPSLIPDKSYYASYCLCTGVLVLILCVFGLFYIVETQGQERKDVWDIQRKKKTRKQALKDNFDEISQISKSNVNKKHR